MFLGVQSGAFNIEKPIMMSIVMIPGAYAGGLTGAWMTSVMPLNILRVSFAILMMVIAVRMFVL